jgi:peptidoglycan hydrolase CwlO-like protein
LRADVARLQGRLAESVPKSESEAKLNELQTKLSGARQDVHVAESTVEDLKKQLTESSANILELQSKVSGSVPRMELDAARTEAESKIRELQSRLSESKSKADALEDKVTVLQSRLTEAERKLERAGSRIKEFEAAEWW